MPLGYRRTNSEQPELVSIVPVARQYQWLLLREHPNDPSSKITITGAPPMAIGTGEILCPKSLWNVG